MSMTFYYAPMSTAVIAHWAIEELKAPVEKVKMDLVSKKTREAAYLALNPNGKVPLLIVDGTPIFETVAIIDYLGQTYGVDKGLYPAAGLKRAEAMKWMSWSSVSLGFSGQSFLNATSDRVPKDQHNPAQAKESKAEAERLLGILDADLAKDKRPYLLGNDFTLADVHVAGWIGYVGMVGFDLSKWPALHAWAQRCSARPAFGVAMSPS